MMSAHLRKYRDSLEATRLQTSNDRDKLVVSIAGGTLAVSVTFFEKIAPHPTVEIIAMLAIGWLGSIVAVLLVLLSLHASETAHELQRDETDLAMLNDGRPPSGNTASDRTRAMNYAASFCVVGGVMFVLIAAITGLVHEGRVRHATSSNGGVRP